MFLTIDGYSGAGKTTQLYILANKLNLKPVNYHHVWTTFIDVAGLLRPQSEYIQPFASLQAIHTIPNLKDCISDHFWDKFNRLYFQNPEYLPEVLEFFRTGMRFNDRPEPDLSIFIDVPWHLVTQRRVERDTNIKVPPIDSESKPDSRKRQSFWRTVEAEIPYFHRVNGNQSVEDVTESIMALIPK